MPRIVAQVTSGASDTYKTMLDALCNQFSNFNAQKDYKLIMSLGTNASIRTATQISSTRLTFVGLNCYSAISAFIEEYGIENGTSYARTYEFLPANGFSDFSNNSISEGRIFTLIEFDVIRTIKSL